MEMDRQTFSKLYHVRYAMIERCYNQNCKAYHNYGGRGIMVCEEWLRSIDSFIQFALSHGWNSKLSIDRIDNDGDYEPDNVRFVTAKENCRNKRNQTRITIGGVTRVLADWADISGVGRATIGWRYKNGVRGDALLERPDAPVMLTIDGIRKPITEWAKSINIPLSTLRKRISDRLPVERLLQPYRVNKRSALTHMQRIAQGD